VIEAEPRFAEDADERLPVATAAAGAIELLERLDC